MKYSSPDNIQLAIAVEQKFLDLCGAYQKIKGVNLTYPPDMRHDFVRWRTMCARHRAGDYRHTDAELKSTREVAQWTVDVNCRLRNQPTKQLTWKD